MTTSSTARQRLSLAQRAELLQAFRHRGLSQRAFAAQCGIGLSTLQLWLRAARATGAQVPGFMALPNPLPVSAAASAYHLRWADGLVLELGRGWVAEELAVLLQVVEGRCSR